MQFVYEPALEKYMLEKKKTNIIVEPVEVNNSDCDVTELHVYLANDKQAEFFKTKKKYKGHQTDLGEVLLPNYRLEYEETVVFGLKKFLFIRYVTYKGIRL